MSGLEQLAGQLGPLARRDQPLGALTTYRVGGPAALMVEAASEADLHRVRDALGMMAEPPPVLVVGKGSNLLVADAGFPGLAVRLGEEFAQVHIGADAVTAGGATPLPVLARQSARAGRRGLEWAVGVPGSVGGGVRMNAGGHGSDMSASLRAWRMIDLLGGPDGDRLPEDLQYSYRHSSVAAHQVVVEATFAVQPGDPEEAEAEISEIVRWRRQHQPGGQNAGSVFTNPPEDSAGRLIEACGLKGARLGSAQVSEKHANFIQADAGGSADDVRRLMDLIRERVEQASGVALRTEVRLIGFSEPNP